MAEQDEHRPEPGSERDAGRVPAEGAPQDSEAAVPDVPADVRPAGDPEAPADRSPGERTPGPGESGFDEEAAWAAIVAGYGEEPPDPPGARPFRSVEDLSLLEPDDPDTPGDTPDPIGDGTGARPRPGTPGTEGDGDTGPAGSGGGPASGGPTGPPLSGLGSSVSFPPGLGPRDYVPAEPDEADGTTGKGSKGSRAGEDGTGGDDEGHFVPPDPQLPAADTTAKFAWLAVLGGPLLLLLAVLLSWPLTWWLTTLSIGGFVGGFFTLVARMDPGDEDDDDPGRGAVV